MERWNLHGIPACSRRGGAYCSGPPRRRRYADQVENFEQRHTEPQSLVCRTSRSRSDRRSSERRRSNRCCCSYTDRNANCNTHSRRRKQRRRLLRRLRRLYPRASYFKCTSVNAFEKRWCVVSVLIRLITINESYRFCRTSSVSRRKISKRR